MSPLAERTTYKVAQILFAENSVCSVPEIIAKLQQSEDSQSYQQMIKCILNQFRENGILTQQGSKYALSLPVIK